MHSAIGQGMNQAAENEAGREQQQIEGEQGSFFDSFVKIVGSGNQMGEPNRFLRERFPSDRNIQIL